MACVSCIANKATGGRARFRQVRPSAFRCDDCGGDVCRLHANRDDGCLRCRECAREMRRRLIERLQGA